MLVFTLQWIEQMKTSQLKQLGLHRQSVWVVFKKIHERSFKEKNIRIDKDALYASVDRCFNITTVHNVKDANPYKKDGKVKGGISSGWQGLQWNIQKIANFEQMFNLL